MLNEVVKKQLKLCNKSDNKLFTICYVIQFSIFLNISMKAVRFSDKYLRIIIHYDEDFGYTFVKKKTSAIIIPYTILRLHLYGKN